MPFMKITHKSSVRRQPIALLTQLLQGVSVKHTYFYYKGHVCLDSSALNVSA